MPLKILPLLIIVLLTFNVSARFDDSTDLRLSRAKIAFADRKYRIALKFLSENIRSGIYNIETYTLLADIYIRTGKYSKALRALYFIIKNGHNKDILNIATKRDVQKILSRAPTPSREILGIYYKVALIWFNLERQGYYKKSYQKSLLRQAKKYFLICNHYQYRIKDTKFYLALLERQDDNNNSALEHLISIKELFKSESINDSKKIKSVDFLIADTLIHKRNYDGGSIYLKSIYNDSSSSSAMNSLAGQYMNALEDNGLSADFTLSLKADTNPAELSTDQKENSNYNNTTSSAYKAIDLYYSSKRYSYWSFLTSFNFKENTNTDEEFSIFDQRNIGVGVEVKYDNLEKGLFRLKYKYNKEYFRDAPKVVFKSFYSEHAFTPSYTHNLTGKDSFGVLSYELPIVFKYHNLAESSATDIGVTISYKPFFTTKYYAPIYAGSLKILNEQYNDEIYRFNSIKISFGNEMAFSNATKLYLLGEYTIAAGIVEDSSYHELKVATTLGHELDFIKNLFINAKVEAIISDKFNQDKYSKYLLSSGVSYSF